MFICPWRTRKKKSLFGSPCSAWNTLFGNFFCFILLSSPHVVAPYLDLCIQFELPPLSRRNCAAVCPPFLSTELTRTDIVIATKNLQKHVSGGCCYCPVTKLCWTNRKLLFQLKNLTKFTVKIWSNLRMLYWSYRWNLHSNGNVSRIHTKKHQILISPLLCYILFSLIPVRISRLNQRK